MAKTRFRTYRPLIALGLFLVAWWVLPTFFKSFLQTSFREFHAPAWVVTSYLDDLEGFWSRRSHSKLELIEAGREIARRKAFYEIQVQRNASLEAQIARLESILNLPEHRKFRYEVARVIRRDLSAWWQHIIIRKGRKHGIPVGAAVVFADGVVGQVDEVNAMTSRVKLATSPTFRMAATFEGDTRPVVYQGKVQSGFSPPAGEVRDVAQDFQATEKHPLKLVTTPLGGAFPGGIEIGRVHWLEPGSTGIFQTGEVRLTPQLLNLYEVAVLIPKNPQTRASYDP
ncbi:MAG: rod shape-determining protein MreC [Opitutales bacterium]